MIPVDSQTMLAIAPRFSGALADSQAAIVTAVGAALQATLDRYAIDTALRTAHFLAQTCHESAGFRTTEEFASGQAYEGRADLGNTQPGDGPRYKGRGLIQLTGRANYRTYGAALGLDLEGTPTLAAEPANALLIACEYWKRRNINAACDRDDIAAVTRLINGGLNGLDDRAALTAKAKAVLAGPAGGPAPAPGAGGGTSPLPVLRQGATGDAVARLQALLRAQGFAIAVDGRFGPGTQATVLAFQGQHGLAADGVVGSATWGALQRAGSPAPAA